MLTMFGVLLAGAGPFGILWLYYDHQQYQPVDQLIVAPDNSTMIDSLESATFLEKPYTFPLMALFLLMGVFSETSNGTLLDVIGLAVSMREGADFARQKLWGTDLIIYSNTKWRIFSTIGSLPIYRFSWHGSIPSSMRSPSGEDFWISRWEFLNQVWENRSDMFLNPLLETTPRRLRRRFCGVHHRRCVYTHNNTPHRTIRRQSEKEWRVNRLNCEASGRHDRSWFFHRGWNHSGDVLLVSLGLPTRLRYWTWSIENTHRFYKSLLYGIHLSNLPCYSLQTGLLLTTNGIGLMVVLSLVKVVIGKLGEANTLVISMLLFSLRFISFYYLQWVIPTSIDLNLRKCQQHLIPVLWESIVRRQIDPVKTIDPVKI